jgi:2-keto-4-pentenoate hydratase/2-oxohepta-3-ene-1,7-dioic acid hydratase in catechol pathway
MRLVTIRPRGQTEPQLAGTVQLAVLLEGGAALTLSGLARVAGWPVSQGIAQLSLAELLAADPELGAIRQALAESDPTAIAAAAVPAAQFRVGSPIPRPGKIVGVGYNYLNHIREQGLERPARPVLFSMFANAVTSDGEPIRRPAGTHALDLEAELAVVIGRRAQSVKPEEGLSHVAGYTVANDVTARDWQGQARALRPGEKGDGQWLRAKGSDTFLPLGPVLVTADELGDGRGLHVRSWRTAATGSDAGTPFQMQDGNSADLLFSVGELVSIISSEVTLEPGDVIVTGTPSGVGVFREPQIFLEPGDVVTVEVERIGSLTNPVTDENGRAPAGSPAARFMAERAVGQTAENATERAAGQAAENATELEAEPAAKRSAEQGGRR